MRAVKRIREVPAPIDGSFESLLTQFSATTLELSPSLGTAEFARRLTTRATEIFGARASVLVLERAQQWEIAALSGPAHKWKPEVQRRLAMALEEQAGASTVMRAGTAGRLLGRELAEDLDWHNLLIVRLVGSEGLLLGVLCLEGIGGSPSPARYQLLEALASHASVALENVRLFSRVERSRKQWIEDFDAISDFIVVHDNAGIVLRLNRALADLLGVLPVASVGRDIGRLGLLASPVISGKCPFCRDLEDAHEEFIHPAGNREYLVSTSRIRADDENEVRSIHVIKDITDRREAERRYRREQDFNRNILNNTQSMILVLGIDGLITYANRRCLESGYCEEDLIGRPLVEIVSGAQRPVFAQALERTLHGEPIGHLEIPLFGGKGISGGISGKFSISLSPMRDDKGAINSVVVVMTDVTDASSLQAKLMHTEKMAALGQLVSGVAHEVNNPLAAIVGFTDLLLEDPAIPEAGKQELRIILQEAQRTRVIVQNLLNFARQMPAQQEPVQINSALRRMLQLRAYDFSNHGFEVTERFDEELPLTIGDVHKLEQVFLNLINNAYDAVGETERAGRLDVVTSHRDGRIEIAFRDNGPGISNSERIFEPFFTTKEVGKGTGLGLSICYGIVHTHGGEIAARNNPDGPGCTFFVRLPVAPQAAELLAAEIAI